MTGTAQGSIRRIKACANGGRSRDEHPGVPVTPAELAESAAGAVAAGAEAIHIHPRGAELILLALELWARSGPR